MNNTLQGRRALVTGSLQGIGHAVALALAQEGCQIVLHGLGPQALQDCARQAMLAAGAPSVVVYTHDVSDPGEIAKLMAAVLAEGPIDILVNNAGIQHVAPLAEMPDATDEVFSLADADTITQFAIANGLAGIHYWSYDRDTDCPPGSASSTCNTLGTAGTYGFLKRFLNTGLH